MRLQESWIVLGMVQRSDRKKGQSAFFRLGKRLSGQLFDPGRIHDVIYDVAGKAILIQAVERRFDPLRYANDPVELFIPSHGSLRI